MKKTAISFSLLTILSPLAFGASDGPVFVTNGKGGALVIESAQSSDNADYLKSTSADGIITLKPLKAPIAETSWYISDTPISADNAPYYCGAISGSWRAPTTSELSAEFAKENEMDPIAKLFVDLGLKGATTAVTYFSDAGFNNGLLDDDGKFNKWHDVPPDLAEKRGLLYALCIKE